MDIQNGTMMLNEENKQNLSKVTLREEFLSDEELQKKREYILNEIDETEKLSYMDMMYSQAHWEELKKMPKMDMMKLSSKIYQIGLFMELEELVQLTPEEVMNMELSKSQEMITFQMNNQAGMTEY